MSDTIDMEMESVVPLESEKPDKRTARQITSLSADTLERRYPQYVIRLSARRKGMKIRHALEIAAGQT